MALRDRLKRLREQSGAVVPSAAPRPPGPSVAERVSRLRAGAPGPASPPRQRPSPEAVAERLGGVLIAPGLVLSEQRLPLQWEHGHFPIADLLRQDLAHLPEAQGVDPAGLVCVDTETTGLAGGTGTVVFLLGMARVTGEVLTVRQYLLLGFAGEAAMLEHAATWLEGGGGLVSFNGKGFDLPLLAARCRLRGVADPFAGMPHLDLLYPTRRGFARRWPDCRLATAEQRLLGFVREDDLPGAEAPEAWFAWLHRGDPGRLAGVARHNHWDLVSLAVLLPTLARVHAAPLAWQADVPALARMYRRQGEHARALALLEEAAPVLEADGERELAALLKRARRWPEACAIWERLADGGCGHSLEQLAMYHEHQRRDAGAAMIYARRLSGGPGAEQRLRRLAAKLSRGEGETEPRSAALFD